MQFPFIRTNAVAKQIEKTGTEDNGSDRKWGPKAIKRKLENVQEGFS